jgi:aminoglycoside phosphotransferase (APT) family kinase protein
VTISDALVLDLTAVTAWMDAHGLIGGPVSEVRELAGGTQNTMTHFRRGEHRYILRRPPRHRRSSSNRGLLREARVLAALEGTPVPVPHLVATCTDPTVLGGAVFYLMNVVDGFNCTVELAPAYDDSSALRHEMGLRAAATAAAVSRVDIEAVGLADFGHPTGFLDRQVPRWMAELDNYSKLAGYKGSQLPELDRIAGWLSANQPKCWTPGLMHGDFHLGNLLYDRDVAQVAAVVDWEMATIGDPMLDLGWLLATWPTDEQGNGYRAEWAIATAGGLPPRSEVVATYAALSGRDVSAAAWYQALACFKLAIILEGTYARSLAGRAPTATGLRLHRRARELMVQASRVT